MDKKWYQPDFKIGMLGGGQLGRMFIQEALSFGAHVSCLDPDPEAPCAQLCENFTCGSLLDYNTVLSFGEDKDVVTIEIENVNVEALAALEKMGKKVYPSPKSLAIIKDKGLQKLFYHEHGIPTAPFRLYDSAEELKMKEKLPFVQKMRTGGYDGKGVKVLQREEQLKDLFDVPSVVEEMVPFAKEISVIVARNANGDTKAFPTVECEFSPEANLVEFLFSPAEINPVVEENAQALALQVVEALDFVGILAVEMFLTKSEELLVNEIAPRPHNSGHHTIEANVTSQFEQHLRSILNLPLGSTQMISPAVMINLLGAPGHSGTVFYKNLEQIIVEKSTHIHLYGKSHTKPFRKMGHITVCKNDLKLAKSHAIKIKELISVESHSKIIES